MTEVRCISHGVIRIVVGAMLLSLIVTDASSQSVGNSGSLSDMSPLDLLRERMTRSASSPGGVPQEGAVDPDEYRVGPGDVFQIGIGGLQALSLPITVSSDGQLTLPDVGTIFVAGTTLAVAREKILDRMKSAYRNVQVTASLAQPRRFYVHVVGAVTSPGRYLVMPLGRVLDGVSLAFADTTRAATSNLHFRPSFRNITVTGIDGVVRSVDLVMYLTSGDTRQNPYLRDGDVIQVSAYDPAVSSVFVNGDVPFAGSFEYREGDSVADLLALASGSSGVEDAFRLVRITRTNSDGSIVDISGTTDVAAADLASVPVQALDQIYVRREGAEYRGVVIADGALRYPGSYPIEKGKTTLRELVEAAGGFRPDALTRGAYLDRRAALSMAEVPTRFVGLSLGPNTPPVFLPDTSAIIRRVRLAPMDWRGTNYVLRELRTERRVSLNLAEATDDEMAGILLIDGDRLVVPKDDKTIFVFGQVRRAGFVPYEAERVAAFYLTKAGGRAELAADVYVVEAGSGAYMKGEDAPVRPGDMIFVDSRDYLANTAELSRLAVEQKRIEADQRFRTTQIILQTIGSIASIIALIISASR